MITDNIRQRLAALLLIAFIPAAWAATAMSPRAAQLEVPLSFEPNRGQTEAPVRFLAHGAGYGLFLTDQEAIMRFASPHSGERGANPSAELRLRLDGAQAALPQARLPQEGRSNYFSVDGSTEPVTDVPRYAELVYRSRYPGIDQVFYGTDGQLEYDFVLAPQADPSLIALRFDGADALRLVANGDLQIDVAGRTLVQHAPVAFQYAQAGTDATRLRHGGSARSAVTVRYALDDEGRVRFELGGYDRSRPLVIDPVFAWSSCLGGTNEDTARDLVLGTDGSVFVVGDTNSSDFPVVGAIQGYNGPGQNAFVTRLNAAGSAAVYSTYLGGSGYHVTAMSVAINGNGEAFVTGTRQSLSAPYVPQAFLLKLNAAGNAVVFSDIFGGNGSTFGRGVALDSNGNAVVVGFTESANFPALNALQANPGGGMDAFVRRYSPTGTVLSSSYLGGANDQYAYAVAVGPGNAIYIGGRNDAVDVLGDAFALKLNATASAVAYSRTIGGSDRDVGHDIIVDAASRAYLAGQTFSANFPVANAIDSTFGGSGDGFLTVFDATGAIFVTSTFLGSADSEAARSVALGPGGEVYVTGSKSSGSGGSNAPFLLRLGAAFNSVVYSIRLGGFTSYGGETTGLSVDAAGAAYVAGLTLSGMSYPSTTGAFQQCFNGSSNGFVSKVIDGGTTLSIADVGVPEGNSNQARQVTVTLTAPPVEDVTFTYATADGSALVNADYYSTSGTGTIRAGTLSTTLSVTLKGDTVDEPDETFLVNLSNISGAVAGDVQAVVTILDDDVPPPTASNNGPVCSGQTLSLIASSVSGASYSWSGPNGFSSSAQNPSIPNASTAASGTYSVVATVDGASSDPATTVATVNACTISIAAPLPVAEGDSGTTSLTFTVTLQPASTQALTVDWNSADGSAVAPGDYLAASGVLTIPANAGGATLAIDIVGDTVAEASETFFVTLTASSAGGIGNAQAIGTIANDDASNGSLHMTECAAEISELVATIQLTVERTNGSHGAIGVSFDTFDGTALAGADYAASSGTLSWASGDTGTRTITLSLINQAASESREDFLVKLSAPTGGAGLTSPPFTRVWVLDGQDQVFVDGFDPMPSCD